MVELTDFQRECVELVSEEEQVPTALLRYDPQDGPEMLLQNGWADEDDHAPQFDLLSAYVLHLSQRADVSREDVYDEVDRRLDSWQSEDQLAVESEQRGGDE